MLRSLGFWLCLSFGSACFFPFFLNTSLTLTFRRNVSNSSSDFAGMFVRRFYLPILTDVLFVLTDRMHKSGAWSFFTSDLLFITICWTGFKLQCQILQAMISVVENGLVQVPLSDPSQQPPVWFLKCLAFSFSLDYYLEGNDQPGIPTSIFEQFALSELSKFERVWYFSFFFFSSFFSDHILLSSLQVQAFISGLCDPKRDSSNFMVHIRDCLVQSKEFVGEADLELLYSEEKEAEEQMKRNALQAKHAGDFLGKMDFCNFVKHLFAQQFLECFRSTKRNRWICFLSLSPSPDTGLLFSLPLSPSVPLFLNFSISLPWYLVFQPFEHSLLSSSPS
jgi:hypothetical protein